MRRRPDRSPPSFAGRRPRPGSSSVRYASRRLGLDDSIFYVGSIAKQFVAACVALLERDGRSTWKTACRGYVPRLPAWGDRVTIRHLRPSHGRREGAVERRSRACRSTACRRGATPSCSTTLRQVTDLDFEPGTRYGYSNRGYLLLAEVVAAASGATLADLARERIFEPLGMRDTFFRDAADAAARSRPPRALRGQPTAACTRSRHASSGGGRRAVDDRRRPRPWNANSTTTGSPAGGCPSGSRPAARSTTARPIHYAWGVSVRTHRGLPIVSHGGNFPGGSRRWCGSRPSDSP